MLTTEAANRCHVNIGSAWIQGGTTAVLRTPSAIIPTRLHPELRLPDMRKLRVGPATPFNFDPRTWEVTAQVPIAIRNWNNLGIDGRRMTDE